METIVTDRLRLRNFCPEDWRDLHEMIVGYQASEYAQYDDRWPTGEEDIQGDRQVANLPSRRLLDRLGFRALGGGQYALERDEWLPRR